MKVLLVHEAGGGTAVNGAVLRRESLAAAAQAAGHELTQLALPSRRPGANFLTRGREPAWSELAGACAGADLVHVAGLPLFRLPGLLRASGVPCVWDLCDSWPLLYRNRLRVRAGPRGAGAFLAAVRAVRSADPCVRTYIAERDRSWDGRVLAGRPSGPAFVVPNVLAPLHPAPGAPVPRGRIVTFGDWAYLPNRLGLDWLSPALRTRRLPVRVEVYGPGAAALPAADWYRARGYVPQLGTALADAPLVAAPCVAGAGVKNKVLVAAAGGLPVVTTAEGVAGIADPPPWVAVVGSAPEFVAQLLRWWERPPMVDQAALADFRARFGPAGAAQRLEVAYRAAVS